MADSRVSDRDSLLAMKCLRKLAVLDEAQEFSEEGISNHGIGEYELGQAR